MSNVAGTTAVTPKADRFGSPPLQIKPVKNGRILRKLSGLCQEFWIHDTFREHWGFEWQEGYGAFSIGISGVEDTTKYIQGQAEHHRKTTFKEELEVFLKKHGMEYVEQDLE